MTAYNIVGASTLIGGQPEDVSQILANFQAIAAVVNGGIDDTNIAPGANIAESKIAGGVPSASGSVPVGTILRGGWTTPPSGFLTCDGTAVSRSTYATLFSAIGTAYGGGDGGTTFNLPDFGGRVAVGFASGAAAEVNALGKSDGQALASRTPKHRHTTSGLTLPDHAHALNDPGHRHELRNYQYATTGNAQSSGWSDTAAGTYGSSQGYPAQTGMSVGSVTSNPPINGVIGPGAAPQIDSACFLTILYVIRYN